MLLSLAFSAGPPGLTQRLGSARDGVAVLRGCAACCAWRGAIVLLRGATSHCVADGEHVCAGLTHGFRIFHSTTLEVIERGPGSFVLWLCQSGFK